MGLGGPAWALSLGQASSGRRKPGPWRGSLIPSFILHVFVEHLICAMQTPCSVLGTGQWTRPLPSWRSLSDGGTQTKNNNKEVKYIVVQSDKC